MNRRLIGIFLLYIWVFTCSSAFVAYQMERYYCHLEHFGTNKHHLSRDQQFVEFEFSDPGMIKWELKNKEIEIGQQFYDVIRIEVSGTKVVLKCISDKKESRSRSVYLSVAKGKTHQGRNSHFKPISLTFIKDSHDFQMHLQPEKNGLYNHAVNHPYLTSQEIHSPPPEIA